MGKTFLGILATTVACSLGAAGAAAAGSRGGRRYVDADGNGICDYNGGTCVYADADGDGVCDVCGASHGYCHSGTAFADADGDGVCDNYAPGQCWGDGSGGQRGCGSGSHHGGSNRGSGSGSHHGGNARHGCGR